MFRQNFTRNAVRFFLIAGSLILIGGLYLHVFVSYDQGASAVTLSMFCLVIGLTLEIMRMQHNIGRHQSIGGYFPSRDLDSDIHDEYLKRYNPMKRDLGLKNAPKNASKYTSRIQDAERLINLLPNPVEDGYCIENKARRSFTCTYIYNGKPYSGTSGSKEMAICIAFLRSCDNKDVKM